MDTPKAEKRVSVNEVDYYPDASMTFRQIHQHIQNNIFNNLSEHEKVFVAIHIPASNLELAMMSDQDISYIEYLIAEFSFMALIKCSLDDELLSKYHDVPEAIKIKKLLEELLDTQTGNPSRIDEICLSLTATYSDFLVSCADRVFSSSIHDQFKWLQNVNRFEDTITVEKRPLDDIGVYKLKELFENARQSRHNSIASAQTVSLTMYNGLKDVDKIMEDFINTFSGSNFQKGQGSFRSIHPGALNAMIREATKKLENSTLKY